MAYIQAISYYLPEAVLTNQLIHEAFPEWDVEKISSKTGIHERHIAASDEFTSDLATKAAEKLFEEHQIDRSSIDFVLLCTQSPDYFLPTTACLVQHRLGLSKNAGAIDFNLGCSGFVYGLSLAKGLIAGGIAKNVLLITAEAYSKFIHPSDKSNRTIFGDAAAATLITAAPGKASIGEFVLGTDGSGAENLIVKNGACKQPDRSGSTDVVDEYNNVTNDNNLYMNGPEIFNFTSEAVPELIAATLEKNKLVDADLQLYIFHQANKYMLNHLRKKMGIDEQRFWLFLRNCGNTVSSTIPIALAEAMRQGAITGDARVLLAGFGVGYSWGGCVIQFNEQLTN